MSRYLFPVLFVLVLVSPFALRAAIGRGDVEAGPLGDLRGRLTIVTPHNADIRRQFREAFGRWHTERFGYAVDLQYRSVGGTNDIVKTLTVFYNQVRADNGGTLPPPEQVRSVPYDMVWGGGDFVFDVELKRGAGALQVIDLPTGVIEAAFPESQLGGINLYDRDPAGVHWVGVCLSSFGIVYSPFFYDRLGLVSPDTWADLTLPALEGRLVLADPAKSGSAAVAYMMVLQRAMADAEEAFFSAGNTGESAGYDGALDAGWRRGMGDLLLIAANTRYFTDSASAVPADVSHANAAAGTAIDFYGRVEEETVGSDRIRYVSPVAATATNPDPIAVCYGTTGDTLVHAERFIEFLLTPEAQRLWQVSPPGGRPLRRTPIRRDIFADQTGWSDADNPFATSSGFNQRAEWMGTFTETRAVWKAAWIEAGEPLRRTHRAVLAVPDPVRRAQLLERLRDIPMTRQAIETLRASRRALPGPEQPSFMASESARIAAMFRDHYAQVRREAETGPR